MTTRLALMVGGAIGLMSVAYAQFGRSNEWVTGGYDAQRSHWVRADAKISVASMQKPGFQFLWKMKLNNAPKQGNALTPPMIMDRLIGYKGFRALVFVGGSSDKVLVIDSDLARMEWQLQLPSGSGASTPECPGGLTSALSRPGFLQIQPPSSESVSGGLGGRGGPAKSGVGEPGLGAVTLRQSPAPRPNLVAPASTTPPGRKQRPTPPGASGGFGANSAIYALSSSGMYHSLNTQNGADLVPPIQFLPPNANASGLILLDGVVYAATTNSCGGAPDGIWALDVAAKTVRSWKADSGLAGNAGPVFGGDGTIYAATKGGQLAAIDGESLKQGASYSAGVGFVSSPVVFEHKGKALIAAATRDGRIHVVDAATMSGVAKSPAYTSATNFEPGALTSWQDRSGTRWILAATSGPLAAAAGFSGSVKNGAVVAFKLVDRGGSPAFEAGWVSPDMISPFTPPVLNGVVFAVAGGSRGTPASLHAIDGSNGKVLWSGGKEITSFARSGGLTGGAGQVYLSTHDGTLYAYGFPMEH